jgi:hypothetical protein
VALFATSELSQFFFLFLFFFFFFFVLKKKNSFRAFPCLVVFGFLGYAIKGKFQKIGLYAFIENNSPVLVVVFIPIIFFKQTKESNLHVYIQIFKCHVGKFLTWHV